MDRGSRLAQDIVGHGNAIDRLQAVKIRKPPGAVEGGLLGPPGTRARGLGPACQGYTRMLAAISTAGRAPWYVNVE